MKKILFFTALAALLASCSHKPIPKFGLDVNIQNNNSLTNKQFVISQMVDGSDVYTDTVKIEKDQFQLDIPYKGPALIYISIPNSDIRNIMMASTEDKGKIQLTIDRIQSRISGTLLNDRLQAFYQGSDSVSQLFQQLDSIYQSKSKVGPLKPQVSDEYNQKRSQLLKENTDRIVAFIKENIDNQVGEYYFMTNYITFPIDRKLQLNSFATPKLKSVLRIK
jgi:hypothetical protein